MHYSLFLAFLGNAPLKHEVLFWEIVQAVNMGNLEQIPVTISDMPGM